MSALAEQLLHALADGEVHSATQLARALGAGPAALEPPARCLAEWGLRIERTADGDWRLRHGVELLDAADLLRRVGSRAPLATLEVLTQVDSTNARLAAAPAPAPGAIAVCTAEFQTAGRGRRGRRWSCPLGAGLCLSAAWQFAASAPDLGALTLAVGVAARRAIATVSGVHVGLKWPNDLLWDGRKLGGILVEATALGGARRIVAGVGINVALPREGASRHGAWPANAVDLGTATGGKPPRRAALAAELIVELAALLGSYAVTGFGPYRAEWDAADVLVGRPITLDEDGERSVARAVAIAADGALVIETAGGENRRVLSGDVSVRSA